MLSHVRAGEPTLSMAPREPSQRNAFEDPLLLPRALPLADVNLFPFPAVNPGSEHNSSQGVPGLWESDVGGGLKDPRLAWDQKQRSCVHWAPSTSQLAASHRTTNTSCPQTPPWARSLCSLCASQQGGQHPARSRPRE